MIHPRNADKIVAIALLIGCSSTTESTHSPGTDAGIETSTEAAPKTDANEVEDSDDGAVDAYPDTAVEAQIDVVEADTVSQQGQLIEGSYDGTQGSRDYQLYVPKGYDGSPLPLVVVLHGCGQSVSQLASLTRYNELADQKKLLVLWPEQALAYNISYCWNWFLTNHQRRDTGEAAILAAMVKQISATHGVDPKRVHAIGFSAGAAMAIVLGAVFPDVFASIGSVEGCPFQGTPCVGMATTVLPSILAESVVETMGAYARPVPLFAIQGSADMSVPPANGSVLVQQWVLAADRIDDGILNKSVAHTPHHSDKGTTGGYSHTTDIYVDSEGKDLVEYWYVSGLGHAWPGGAPTESYSDPNGPSATENSYQFFESHPMP